MSVAHPTFLGPRGVVRRGATYALSAVIAGLLNIAVQELTRRAFSGDGLMVPLVTGTAAGFAAKYVLDKWVVFADPYNGAATELRKVSVYALLSIGTTVVFWGTETLFWTVWRTHEAKYTGAVLGLTIGYVAKFALDQTFVFRRRLP
jgi:putative flippase GtrA